MTVAEAGSLQGRHTRVADRFRAAWVLHQFASGVSAQLLGAPVTYSIDFPRIHHDIRTVGDILSGTYPMGAASLLDNIEETLDAASQTLLEADRRMHASHLRRFFDRLARPDDAIIECLIRFYFYADAVEGDSRDKIDLLFTRLGEAAGGDGSSFVLRDAADLRPRIESLVTLLDVGRAPRGEVEHLVQALRSMRSEIESTAQFDDFTERNLLRDARTFKHRVGDLYFDPDVLLAVIELNLSAKNRFLRLYGGEEQRLVEDADRLMAHGSAIEQGFAPSNPELAREIESFREAWLRFEKLRAESNVKVDVVARLRSGMNAILAQLERDLAPEIEVADLPPSFIDVERQRETVTRIFGANEPLLEYCMRIDAALENADPSADGESLVRLPGASDLRLEPWEASAYLKLLGRMPATSEEDSEQLWLLYVRAAALRIRVAEEATILATVTAAHVTPEPELMRRISHSLELSKQMDEMFGDLQQEAMYFGDRAVVRQLYRSRFRLLRTFSGLWLIYDQQS